jgi:hypothetical protein
MDMLQKQEALEEQRHHLELSRRRRQREMLMQDQLDEQENLQWDEGMFLA